MRLMKTRGTAGHMKHEGSYETINSKGNYVRARRSTRTDRTARMTGQESDLYWESVRENDRAERDIMNRHGCRKQKTFNKKRYKTVKRKKK